MNKLITAVLLITICILIGVMGFLLWHSRSLNSEIEEARAYDPLEAIIHEHLHRDMGTPHESGGHLDHADDPEAILERFRRRTPLKEEKKN